jgi:hypothetical protein
VQDKLSRVEKKIDTISDRLALTAGERFVAAVREIERLECAKSDEPLDADYVRGRVNFVLDCLAQSTAAAELGLPPSAITDRSDIAQAVDELGLKLEFGFQCVRKLWPLGRRARGDTKVDS